MNIKLITGLAIVCALLAIAFYCGIGYIVVHFIAKIW